ncbi:hypothetical protein HanRHA438_Chr16g0765341 [Helianthus annuus]|uniref:Uncharacterized protein n=1 Tax=Helianthus annuus TaxID=4232 RepID=A0A9K3DS49_HELAN|nr:hypothetical protein HanXRQr2_Chr16g0753501 [Helianthus annuus]KAJ0443251.1 hypothetical protein HanIR_Chr16g0818701 [Helianthus annuus]KAJ0460812.1 hypothetical protein HanHA89_Chr16g0665181 [Helianthus annuus]KAJ0641231.1 hypothetical protein HanLR1_Chr16g0624841 [Helianthus annuus]KAJ0645143.1 hypothetical protein HanOQP8_Chr16g0620561 [Helianthus annuus]
MQKLYDQMQEKIEAAMRLGQVSAETRELHKGFDEWKSDMSSSDHQPIVQVYESVFRLVKSENHRNEFDKIALNFHK